MAYTDFLDEFETDWRLAGKAATTAETYVRYLRELAQIASEPVSIREVKLWLADAPSAQTARSRGCAVRAFGKWAAENDGPDWSWWPRVPLAATAVTPQRTVSTADYESAMSLQRFKSSVSSRPTLRSASSVESLADRTERGF